MHLRAIPQGEKTQGEMSQGDMTQGELTQSEIRHPGNLQRPGVPHIRQQAL